MTQPPKAIFLSYASQDSDAARRLCETLRGLGVEVWFDVEGGLETGDEWDAKIRRQIKECVLFLPVISANTQAREEGYFRIEWDLAAERARGIASGVPFILPIVIDDTRQPDALVPDRFRSVQWTKAVGGELSPEAGAKFAKLWSHRAGVAKHQAAVAEGGGSSPEVSGPSRVDRAPAGAKSGPRLALFLGVATALLGLGALAWKFWPGALSSPASTSAVAASATQEWPRSPELKRAVALLDSLEVIPEDFRLAEELAARELERRPTDPEAVTVMARVHSMWLLRGWDRSNARYQKAKSTAERALQLAPDEPEAQLALAIFHYARNVDLPRAVALAQRAVDLRPDEPRFHRMRDNCLFNLNVPTTNTFLDLPESDESPGLRAAIDSARRTVELFPRDPLARYELARHYRDLGRWAEFERLNDETIALYPLANALVWKARARFGLHGDLAGMKSVLDQVPARVRAIERTVFGYFLYAAYTGESAVGLDVLNGFTEPWMIDFDFRGPKAQLVAALLELEGRKELARIQYDLALTELKQARARNPEDVQSYMNEAWILRGLGRTDEARAALRTFNEALIRPASFSPLGTWWFQAIPANLLLGERAFALTLMREAISARSDGRDTLRRRFALDPRLVEFRDDPEIKALLAEPAAAKPAATASPAITEGGRLVAQARALYTKFAYTREDLATAEELARRATELEPGSAAAWGALAAVHGTYLQRGWDVSEKRRSAAQAAATRATGLDPEQPDALFAMGYVLGRLGRGGQTLELFRRAAAAAPDDNRIARSYAGSLSAAGRLDEARALYEAVLRRDPQDPLAHYNLALGELSYSSGGDDEARLGRCLRHLDAGIAAQPLATLLLFKATLMVGWRADFATARQVLAELEQRPLSERTDDRAVFVPLWIATLERDPARAATVAALTARTYFDDWSAVRRPKDWHLALARQGAGKGNLAKLDWQRAESVVREKLAQAPNEPQHLWELACTLAWLGRLEEARTLFAPIEAAWREEMSGPRAVQLAHYAAACGDGARTAEYLRVALNAHATFTRWTFPRDPWFDRVRDHPDVQKVVSPPAAKS